MPERLGCVDVAEPGQHPLIEQRHLDGRAASPERAAERCGVERRVRRLDAELGERLAPDPVEGDGCQSPRIHERHARPIAEVENGAGVTRLRIVARRHDPIAGHAEVDVEDRSIVERDELVLPPPLDALDDPPAHVLGAFLAGAPTKRWVQEPELDDALPQRRPLEDPSGELHLGQLRHGDAPR
jgi:hypothetical protein